MGTTMKRVKINVGKAARMLAGTGAVLLLIAGSASAQTTSWRTGTGSWFEPGNWTTGVPTSGVTAWIDNGGTAQIGRPGAEAEDVYVGRNLPIPSFLEITSRGTLSDEYGLVASGSGSRGTATVTGTGSKWTNSRDLYVGLSGTGTLNIADGGEVSNRYGYLGSRSGSQGTVTVTGSGSKWKSTGVLYVGSSGRGTLEVTDGGEVSNSGDGYIGFGPGSQGTVTVTGSGSKWTNSRHLSVGLEGMGTLMIADGGEVSNSYAGILACQSGAQGTVTVTGNGSKWTNSGGLYVGDEGTGTLTITDRGEVSNSYGILGHESGSQGRATISGSGSKWTNSAQLRVGYGGTGTLTIARGGQVSSSYGSVGSNRGSQGTAIVTGSGSKWTISGDLNVGSLGTGTLRITAGGEVSNSTAYLGVRPGSRGTATVSVSGIGSKWTNSGDLNVGRELMGTLMIADGGLVSAANVSIRCTGRVAIDVGTGSKLRVGGGTGTLTNHGRVRVLAGAAVPAGAQFAPIAAGTWSDSGIWHWQTIGGSWDGASHVFTVSEHVAARAGETARFDRLDIQRVLIRNDQRGDSLGVSVPYSPATAPMALAACPLPEETLAPLADLIEPGHVIRSAWIMGTEGYTPSKTTPLYLSFEVGERFSTGDLSFWQYTGSQWEPLLADCVSYQGRYAMAMILSGSLPEGAIWPYAMGTGLPPEFPPVGAYAVSAVPELSALALLLAAAFAGVVWQWWRGRRM